MSVTYSVVSTPDRALVYTNHLYVSPDDQILNYLKAKGMSCFIQLQNYIFTISPHPNIQQKQIGLSSLHREMLKVSLNDTVNVQPFILPAGGAINLISIRLTLELIKVKFATLSEKICAEIVSSQLSNQILTRNQFFALDVMGTPCKFTVSVCETPVLEKDKSEITQYSDRGLLSPSTIIEIDAIGESKTFKFEKNASNKKSRILDPNWKFEDMGIGGLDKEFNTLFRRAFATRLFPAKVVQEMGVNHVKGLLLYGPPGTGKTLIARQIGKMLTTREPKIVNGPEILNKFVGASEENIRKLFIEAEADYKENKENADLHIIIFDEIDAICKARGRSGDTGTGVGDTVVNQLLTKIDGVDALNNILVIGMTNRKDLIDPALLRPGRFEVHIEISLPDEKGRVQILNIHTKKMRETRRLGDDVDIPNLASRTKNFSGAEIEGLVKSAASFALYQTVDVTKGQQSLLAGHQALKDDLKIEMRHFEKALDEVKPAFGVDEDELKTYTSSPLYDYGTVYNRIITTAKQFLKNVKEKGQLRFDSLLLQGPIGAGKTSIAAKLALESEFNYVKIINPKQFLGLTEIKKMNDIIKVFEDAYKSTSALIIVDSIERLIEFVSIGPRFSTPIVQCLLTLCSTPPPYPDHHLVVLGTTSEAEILNSLGFKNVFTPVEVPPLTEPEQVKSIFNSMNIPISGGERELDLICEHTSFPIGIRQLLAVIHNMPDGPATAKAFVLSQEARGFTKKSTKSSFGYLQDGDEEF